MQFRKIFHLLTLCSLILICPHLSEAQRIAKNKNGERIVIFPNGNWEYFDGTKTIHKTILKNHLKNNQPEEIIDEQTAKGVSAEILKFEKKLELAREELDYTIDKESDAKYSKEILEEELEELKDDKKVGSKQYKAVEGQLALAIKMEREARKDRKSASRKLKRLKKNKGIKSETNTKVAKSSTSKKPSKKSTKKSEVKKKNTKVAKSSTSTSTKRSIKKYSGSKKSQTQKVKQDTQRSTISYQEDATFYTASKRFKQYRIEEDVMYHPPMEECNLVFDGVDKFLGKKRKDVQRALFFTHTDDDMRQYMLDEDYISCEGSITQITGGVLLLNLFVSITTTDAKRAFGSVSKGSLISIKMIDGSKISLVNNQSDDGSFDPSTRKHTYTLQYLINSGQEKTLRKGEVDFVRMIWETGYEDYEVHNLDFFVDQFRCLNK